MDMKRLPDVCFAFTRIPKLHLSKFDAKQICQAQVPDSKQNAKLTFTLAKMGCCHVVAMLLLCGDNDNRNCQPYV
jgi:hypothetical protein